MRLWERAALVPLVGIVGLASVPCFGKDARPSDESQPRAAVDPMAQWPQWRGPLGTGVAPLADPPSRWSETENVRWKAPLPGLGHSTPAVWGDRIFLTAAIEDDEKVPPRRSGVPGAHDNLPVASWFRFAVLAIDRTDGSVVWQRTVRRALPHEGGHISASLASASPVTDGERVYAFFGSHGLYAFDLGGEPQWQADLGTLRSKHAHGEGASPALHGGTLVVTWDHEGPSFLVALDARTGAERWRVARDEPTSWATPIVTVHRGRAQVIVSGTGRVRGYDLADGAVIWSCGGLSANVVASPVAADGVAVVASSYDIRAMLAIDLDARGDVTGSDRVLWRRTERTPYVPSPLLYDGALYFLRHYQGVLSRVLARTGAEPTGPFRLQGVRNVYASPVGAGGRVYITDRQGTTLVLRHGEHPEALAINRLDDRFSASAALAGDTLFLRGERHLYALAASAGGATAP